MANTRSALARMTRTGRIGTPTTSYASKPVSRCHRELQRSLCESLAKECGIAPTDVVVSMVTTSDEDWSFGNRRAQFLTSELEADSLDRARASLIAAV
ncbi:tautomerase family protein [Bradyrhizobium sp. 186]|nr:tautomerase family protein [Bradyrhizobium sp. 186]